MSVRCDAKRILIDTSPLLFSLLSSLFSLLSVPPCPQVVLRQRLGYPKGGAAAGTTTFRAGVFNGQIGPVAVFTSALDSREVSLTAAAMTGGGGGGSSAGAGASSGGTGGAGGMASPGPAVEAVSRGRLDTAGGHGGGEGGWVVDLAMCKLCRFLLALFFRGHVLKLFWFIGL